MAMLSLTLLARLLLNLLTNAVTACASKIPFSRMASEESNSCA